MTSYLIEQESDYDVLDDDDIFEDFSEQDDIVDDFFDDDEFFLEQRGRRKSPRVRYRGRGRRPLRMPGPVPGTNRRVPYATQSQIRGIKAQVKTLTNNDAKLSSRIQSLKKGVDANSRANLSQKRQLSQLRQDTDSARQLAILAPLLFQPSLDVKKTDVLEVSSESNGPIVDVIHAEKEASSSSLATESQRLNLQNPAQLVSNVSMQQQGFDSTLLLLLLAMGNIGNRKRKGDFKDILPFVVILSLQRNESDQTNSLNRILPILLLTML